MKPGEMYRNMLADLRDKPVRHLFKIMIAVVERGYGKMNDFDPYSTFFQKFDMKDFFMVKPGTKLEISFGKRRHRFHQYYHREEWKVLKYSGSGKFKAEIVFAGYGIHAPDLGYDSYDGIDIKNKIALISF